MFKKLLTSAEDTSLAGTDECVGRKVVRIREDEEIDEDNGATESTFDSSPNSNVVEERETCDVGRC